MKTGSDYVPNEQYVPQLMAEFFGFDAETVRDVYHYTDCNGLISIIRSRELWLSNVSFMNDVLEVEKSIEILEASTRDLTATKAEQDAILRSFKKSKSVSAPRMFVLSLSMNRDSLILWNNYGKTEGYNLGLDAILLSQLSMMKHLTVKDSQGKETYQYMATVGKVLYDDERKREFLRLVLERYLVLMRTQADSITMRRVRAEMTQIWKTVVMYSYMMKQPHHQGENEFRVIVNVPDKAKVVHFRGRNGLVLPYIRFGSGLEALPLNEVTIGPKIDDGIAAQGVILLLEEYNLLAQIEKSKIKLRF